MVLEFLTNLMIAYPKISIIVFSFLVTLVMTLITKKFTNQNRMKELKQIQKACQIKIKENKNDPKVMMEMQKQMMECSMELMKHSFKPLLFTLIPLLIFFWWIRGIFATTELAKNWIWYYIGSGIISSIILRKVLNVI